MNNRVKEFIDLENKESQFIFNNGRYGDSTRYSDSTYDDTYVDHYNDSHYDDTNYYHDSHYDDNRD